MARNKKHKVKYAREVQIMKDILKENANGKHGAPGFT
jgi:hypothetical protein